MLRPCDVLLRQLGFRARRVGPQGRVIGVDMTPEMIEKARENARKGGYANVEFRLGEIEHLPVADGSVDVVLSNCVINLSPNKRQVFAEAFRVLKPGGRLLVSDIVLRRLLPEGIRRSVEAYVGCVAGAELEEAYLEAIRDTGFVEVAAVDETPYPADFLAGLVDADPADLVAVSAAVVSAKVRAVKPRCDQRRRGATPHGRIAATESAAGPMPF